MNQSHECMLCKRRSSRSDPPSNLALKNLCKAFLSERDQRGSEALCSLHMEKLKLFCLNHQQPVCVVCRDSEKHTGHKFRPIDEAAKDRRTNVTDLLKPLQDKLKILHQAKENCALTAGHIKFQAQHAAQQIKEEFKELHKFLDQEEKDRISGLRAEERQKNQMMEEKIRALGREIEELSNTVQITEKALQAKDALFLQNYKALVERVQQPRFTVDPELVSGTLIDVAKHVGNLTYNIWSEMKKLVSYVPVILDPNTAGKELILSEDLRSVRWGHGRPLPENPERLRHLSSTLGSKSFGSGTYSWVVEVGDNDYWELGVISGSVRRKDNVMSGLWRLRFYNGKYRACSGLQQDTDIPAKKIFRSIRVNLDWDKGLLSFSDSDSNMHIHTFTHAFTERLFPYITSVNTFPLKIRPLKICVTVK